MIKIFVLALLSLSLVGLAKPESAPQKGNDKAIDYYRPGAVPPATADLSRGDVPRDSYGRPYTYEGLGQPLPEFAGQMANGVQFQSTMLEGKWTVIQVWGIWCHDSRNDAKYAAALTQALAQDPAVDFMSIHTPPNAALSHRALGNYGSVEAWFQEKGWSYPTLVDDDASIRHKLQIRWTPTYLVVAPDLTVQGFRTGLADAGEMAVKDFVRDVSVTRGDWQKHQN